jgi:hypothetical protein
MMRAISSSRVVLCQYCPAINRRTEKLMVSQLASFLVIEIRTPDLSGATGTEWFNTSCT